jgi:undecaprenyl-diphosphatase
MTLFQSVVLGLVQGATEFLPVSSSGHLVIVPAIFGWEVPPVAFDVLLHLGTLVAVITYFRHELSEVVLGLVTRGDERAAARRLGWLLIAGTIPTAIIGLAFDDLFESLFTEVLFVGVFLLVSAVILTAAERLSRKDVHDTAHLRWWQAALIGVAQGAAIAPGISRSGATMAAGLGLGLDREQAARFSFLLSVPAIALASVWALGGVLSGEGSMPDLIVSLAGFLVAAISGYVAIAALLAYLKRRTLYPFAVYCAVVGVAVVAWQVLG